MYSVTDRQTKYIMIPVANQCLELSYTYSCYQSLTITWLLQTSPQNSLLRLTI